MTERACSIETCDRDVYCRGWCRRHYNKWHRYGDPEHRTVYAEKCPPGCTCYRHQPGGHREKLPSLPCLNCGAVRMVRRCYSEGMRFELKFCDRACFTEHQQKQMALRRATGIAYHYDMSQEEYDARLAAQGGTCAICRKKISGKDVHRDHCHTSGEWRGLLCNNCNTGIGLFGDDVDLLFRAIDYLKNGGVALAGETVHL